jgi:hypothetical protein
MNERSARACRDGARVGRPNMDLTDLLQSKRDLLVARWFDAIARTYPADTARFLKDTADQFNNPVGHTLRRRLPTLLKALLNDVPETDLGEAIADIVRIRTVQCNAPSQAVAFVYLIKKIVREETREGQTELGFSGQLAEFEARVDGLALSVFDEYMRCRETICEIRVHEAQMRSAKLVEQVNSLYGGLNRENANDETKNGAGNT